MALRSGNHKHSPELSFHTKLPFLLLLLFLGEGCKGSYSHHSATAAAADAASNSRSADGGALPSNDPSQENDANPAEDDITDLRGITDDGKGGLSGGRSALRAEFTNPATASDALISSLSNGSQPFIVYDGSRGNRAPYNRPKALRILPLQRTPSHRRGSFNRGNVSDLFNPKTLEEYHLSEYIKKSILPRTLIKDFEFDEKLSLNALNRNENEAFQVHFLKPHVDESDSSKISIDDFSSQQNISNASTSYSIDRNYQLEREEGLMPRLHLYQPSMNQEVEHSKTSDSVKISSSGAESLVRVKRHVPTSDSQVEPSEWPATIQHSDLSRFRSDEEALLSLEESTDALMEKIRRDRSSSASLVEARGSSLPHHRQSRRHRPEKTSKKTPRHRKPSNRSFPKGHLKNSTGRGGGGGGGTALYTEWSRWTRCNRRCKQKRRRRCKKKTLCGTALIKEERTCTGWRCKKRPLGSEEGIGETPTSIEGHQGPQSQSEPLWRVTADRGTNTSPEHHHNSVNVDVENRIDSDSKDLTSSNDADLGDLFNNISGNNNNNPHSSNVHYVNKHQQVVVRPHHQNQDHHRHHYNQQQHSPNTHRVVVPNDRVPHGRDKSTHHSSSSGEPEDSNLDGNPSGSNRVDNEGEDDEGRRTFKVVQGRKSSHRDVRLLLNFNAMFYTRWSDWAGCSKTCLTSRYRWCRYQLFCGGAVVREEAFCYTAGDACEQKYKEDDGVATVQEYLTSSLEQGTSPQQHRNTESINNQPTGDGNLEDGDFRDVETLISRLNPPSHKDHQSRFVSSHSKGHNNREVEPNKRPRFSTNNVGVHEFDWNRLSSGEFPSFGEHRHSFPSHHSLSRPNSALNDVWKNSYNVDSREDVYAIRELQEHDNPRAASFHHENTLSGGSGTSRQQAILPESLVFQQLDKDSSWPSRNSPRWHHSPHTIPVDDQDGVPNSGLAAGAATSSSFASSPSQQSSHSSSTSLLSPSKLFSSSSSYSSSSQHHIPTHLKFPHLGHSPLASSFTLSPSLSSFPSSLSLSLSKFGKSSLTSFSNSSSSTFPESSKAFASSGIIETNIESHVVVPHQNTVHQNTDISDEEDSSDDGDDGHPDATSVESLPNVDYNEINRDEDVQSREDNSLFDHLSFDPSKPPSISASHLSHLFLSHPDHVTNSSSPSLPPPPLPSPSLNAVCGVSRNGLWAQDSRSGTRKAGLSLRILGGREAERGQWPWQVVILNRYKEAFCGGVVVGPQWVLTAAHCVRKRLYARLAEHDLAIREGTEMEFRIAESISHPLYDSTTVDNDVALLRLPQPLDYTPYLAPVCLPPQGEHLPVGQLCTIIGWGKERNTHLFGTDVLHQAEVPIINSVSCRAVYKEYYITDNMFCAGYRGGRVDSCAGDSGGPLLCRHDEKWYVHGITSFGEGCGRRGKYGIYARVSNYHSWLHDVMSAHQMSSRSPDSARRHTGTRHSRSRHVGGNRWRK